MKHGKNYNNAAQKVDSQKYKTNKFTSWESETSEGMVNVQNKKWKHKYFKHLAQIMQRAFGENKALNPEYLIPEATYTFG